MNDHKETNVNEELQSALDQCKQDLQQCRDRLLYLQAEFDNYKKRIEKEKSLWIESSQDLVLTDILPLVDDFHRALSSLQSLPPELQIHTKGLEMISSSLAKLLQKYNIEEIPPMKEFNPEFHEAITQVPSDGHAAGEIVSTLQKGYIRKGRVLRPSQVSVAS